MTRPLLLTAALGFVVSIACFAAAWAFGGFTWRHWMINIDDDDFVGHMVDGGGPTVTRTIPWSGGDTLSIAAPVDVIFTQGPDARMTVTGPRGAAEAVEIEDGRLRIRRGVHHLGGLSVAITAPDVHQFVLAGSGNLKIQALDRDDVAVRIFGSGDVTAEGKAKDVSVDIAGSGGADLGKVQAETAHAHIAGSGDAVLAASQRVEASVAGSGDIRLATEPRELQTHIMGSGDVIHLGGAPAPPVPPAAPAAPAPPPPPAAKVPPAHPAAPSSKT